jgi:hypothetical protein
VEHSFRNTVLVEVDRVENLREAYPNYFLDVTTFAHLLGETVGASTPMAQRPARRTYDLTFLKGMAKGR